MASKDEINARRRAAYARRATELRARGVQRSERSLRRERAAARDANAAQLARDRENARKRYVYAIRKLTRRYAAASTGLKGDLTRGQRFLESMSYADALAFVEDVENGREGRRNYHGPRGQRGNFVRQKYLDDYRALDIDDPDRELYWYG